MPLRNQLFAIFLCASSSVAQTPAIHLAGAPNFRDIGGLATADGHTVRSGRFYRSGQLAALTGDDYATLSALGIRAVFDLRTEGERAESATRWTGSPTPETIGTPIVFGTVPGNLPLADLLRALASKLKTEDDARNLMIGGMAGIAESGRIQIGRVITRLSEGTEPAIVHCTAGKDRTRLLTAVLLTILGVPHDRIVADYLRSNAAMALGAALPPGTPMPLDPKIIRPLMSVEPAYLEASFDQIARSWVVKV